MERKTKFYNRIDVRIFGVLLISFAVIAVVVSLINRNNIRYIYEEVFTEQILRSNADMADFLDNDDVSYYVGLMKTADEGFKQRQVQFYNDRNTLYHMRSSGESPEAQQEVITRLNSFRRETAALKDAKYWRIINDLKALKEANNSEYVYVLADTGLKTEDGEVLFTFIFDAEDGSALDDYGADGLGTCNLAEDSLIMTAETKTQMNHVEYYEGDYGELYFAYTPILDDDGNVAAVLGSDRGVGSMNAAISLSSIRFNAVFFVSFFIIALLIFVYLMLNITRPLQNLTRAAHEIIKGNRTTGIADKIIGQHSDIGTLACALSEVIEESKRNILHLEYTCDNLSAMVCVTDPKTDEMLFINREMRQKLSVTEDYAGRKCYEVLYGREERCSYCPCDELNADPGKEVKWELVSKAAGHIYRSYSKYIKWPDGRTVHIQCAADITDLHRVQNELEDALRKAESANRVKSDFLANMSHEIRTPMNAILGITEIELQKETLPPDTAEALSKIYGSGDLLLNIINDILDFSKIEEDKLEIIPVNYSLPGLINETVQINLVRYENEEVEFIADLDENTPARLFGDKLRIKQILNNILSNALKYTDKGQVRMSVGAEDAGVPGADDDVVLIISVSDTGQGMTEEQTGKIFEEYARFNLDVNRTVQGTGLGMSITKRLIDMMGGSIDIASKVNKGTTVTVRLPQKRTDDSICGSETARQLRNFSYHEAAITKESQITRENMEYGRVLVVDDMESNIYVTKGMLAPYGLQVDTVKSGVEAIEKVRNNEVYDIIFMDYMMPRMNGMEATQTLREMGYKNTVIALTANALTGQAEIFLRNGFDAFISKPIDSRELDAVLRRFISEKKEKRAG